MLAKLYSEVWNCSWYRGDWIQNCEHWGTKLVCWKNRDKEI